MSLTIWTAFFLTADWMLVEETVDVCLLTNTLLLLSLLCSCHFVLLDTQVSNLWCTTLTVMVNVIEKVVKLKYVHYQHGVRLGCFSICAFTTSLAPTRPSVLHSTAMESCYTLLSLDGTIKSASGRLRQSDMILICWGRFTALSSTNPVYFTVKNGC